MRMKEKKQVRRETGRQKWASKKGKNGKRKKEKKRKDEINEVGEGGEHRVSDDYAG